MENGFVYSCTIDELRFLSYHQYLFGVLAEAKPYLTRIFGNRRIHLQIERDPDDGSMELFAVIMVNGNPRKALDLLAQFEQEYFIAASQRTHDRLNFTVDTP